MCHKMVPLNTCVSPQNKIEISQTEKERETKRFLDQSETIQLKWFSGAINWYNGDFFSEHYTMMISFRDEEKKKTHWNSGGEKTA